MDSMDIIKTGKTGKHLNTIYRIHKDNLQMNDTHTSTQTTPYSRTCMNFTPSSNTHTPHPILFIKLELVTQSTHLYTQTKQQHNQTKSMVKSTSHSNICT
jgi:hypothetical protein